MILVPEVHAKSDLCSGGIMVNRAAGQSVVSSKADSGVYSCSPKYSNCVREGTAKLGGRIRACLLLITGAQWTLELSGCFSAPFSRFCNMVFALRFKKLISSRLRFVD